jgi:uncharacterized protein
MAAFAVIAVAAGLTLMSRRAIPVEHLARPHPGLAVLTALGVGFLTGLLGVGGGFIILPALALTGTLIGARTASRARPDVLRRVFGLLVHGVGVYTGAVAFV